MTIKTSDIGNKAIEYNLSQFFIKKIEVSYWNDDDKEYQYGLCIQAPDLNEAISKFNVPVCSTEGQTTYIRFDDSIAFLKKFKEKYQDKFNASNNGFIRNYKDFLNSYLEKIPAFLLTSKIKPSVIANELLDHPIDLFNKESFNRAIKYLPQALENALIEERGLRHYDCFTYGANRQHFIKFSLDEVRTKITETDVLHFDRHYAELQKNGITGDALKAAILANIQKEISACDVYDLNVVNKKYLEIKNRYDYKLLGQSQGITTKVLGIFGVKTSSVQALDKWMNFTYPELMQSTESSRTP